MESSIDRSAEMISSARPILPDQCPLKVLMIRTTEEEPPTDGYMRPAAEPDTDRVFQEPFVVRRTFRSSAIYRDFLDRRYTEAVRGGRTDEVVRYGAGRMLSKGRYAYLTFGEALGVDPVRLVCEKELDPDGDAGEITELMHGESRILESLT